MLGLHMPMELIRQILDDHCPQSLLLCTRTFAATVVSYLEQDRTISLLLQTNDNLAAVLIVEGVLKTIGHQLRNDQRGWNQLFETEKSLISLDAVCHGHS